MKKKKKTLNLGRLKLLTTILKLLQVQTIALDLILVDIILVWNHFLKEKSITHWQKTPLTRLVKTKSRE